MEDLKEICSRIALQEELKADVLKLEKNGGFSPDLKEIERLTEAESWESARERLKASIGEDPCGKKILYCMLKAACFSWKKYQKQGISGEIFEDTMKCFTRFAGEHKVSYGVYGFDRDFWAGRQLSLQLFRLGELEYEKARTEEGTPYISIHIPSDAALDLEKIKASVQMARKFFAWQDPLWDGVPYRCCSWLLSPALKEILGENSRIRKFQDLFTIEEVDKDSKAFMEWVFKKREMSLEDLPEETSLQKNMKARLLSGGWIGEGSGYLNL